MSSANYNHGTTKLADRTVDFILDPIRLMLVSPDYVPEIGESDISIAVAYELKVGGSVRRTLRNKRIIEDSANNRTVYDADDPAPWVLMPGGEAGGAVVFADLGDDAIPLFFLEYESFPTNGSTFSLYFDDDGIAYIQSMRAAA